MKTKKMAFGVDFFDFLRTNSVCEENTKTKKTIIKMAANPILMFASLCCGIMGISFFFGFYFGMVEKDIEHNKEIDDLIARVCVIFIPLNKLSHTNCYARNARTTG